MKTMRSGGVVAIAVAMLISTSVVAATLLEKHDWELLELPRKVAPTFSFLEGGALRVEATHAVGFLYHELDRFDPRAPQLQWRWRVERPIPPTDQAAKAGDDRAIAVHLWFDDDESGSLFGLFGRVLGYPRVGHLITYVYGGKRPPGSVMPNAYYDKGAIIIVRGSEAEPGRWYDEARDITADYRAAFNREPDLAKLRYIAISADTDDTRTSSSAVIANVAITPAKPERQ